MSAIKLALTARRLRAELGDLDLLRSEPIAIIGLGCRFPGGATTPDRFWRLLEAGTDAVREIPPERWDIDAYYDSDPGVPAKMNTKWAGLLERVDQFDAEFFGIAPREAAAMDPQQRLLLEVAWETLNDAGYPPESLSNSSTGIFFAIYNSDYSRLQFSDLATVGAHTSSGTSHGIAAGRLSYLLNLNGPSMAIDTACSSSLVAVHLACQSLRSGECSLALAGGVSVLISPEETISLSKWGMLAPDGRCKTFDASANGFVRGEGCGIVALKRLADALADGDPICALVRGSAVNQDGRSTMLTAPNGLAQQAVVSEALRNARVRGDQLSYIEAHGTGTALGDPIEIEALANAVGQSRPDGSTCRVGSVKTNLGHLEAAAGVAGLIKVVLAIRHQKMPPHLHFKSLNPLISLEGTCLTIGSDACPWPITTIPRFAGVSSFGFGGTNAHVVLEEAPQLPARKESGPGADSGPWLLPISARNDRVLAELKREYLDFLIDKRSEANERIRDTCFTASLRRWHYPMRAAIVGQTWTELAERLNEDLAGSEFHKNRSDAAGKLVFVFSGHGSQWIGMGRSLLENEPVFSQAFEECDAAVRSVSGWSVLEALAATDEKSRLYETEVFQPVLFALQTALAALWRSWGIVPDAVIGHSVGEIAAAHVAGAINLEDAAKIAVLRGRLMQTVSGNGAMAAVEMPAREAAELILRRNLPITVAAINAPSSVTMSGCPEELDQLLTELAAGRIETHRLKVNCAFHSPVMEAASEMLGKALSDLHPNDAGVPIYSTVEGHVLKGKEFDAVYWRRNIREPVQFAGATAAALQTVHSVFLEVSPHPVLARALGQCIDASGRAGSVLASMRRGQDERTTLLNSLASLYTLGKPVEWKALYPGGGRCVSLPPYPWEPERHWVTPAPKSSEKSDRQVSGSMWPERILRSAFFEGAVAECLISSDRPRFIDEHRVGGVAIVPATAIIDLAFITAAHASRNPKTAANEPVRFPEAFLLENFAIDQAILLPENETRTLQLGYRPEDGSFQLFSRPVAQYDTGPAWTEHAAGSVRLTPLTGVAAIDGPALACAKAVCTDSIDVQSHYEVLRKRGIEFGPLFRRIVSLWRGEQSGLAQIRSIEQSEAESTVHVVHPAILDACLQAIAPALPDDDEGAYIPRTIERVWLSRKISAARWSFARLRDKSSTSDGTVVADVWIFEETGLLAACVGGLRLQRVDSVHLAGPDQTADKRSLYEIGWEEQPLNGRVVRESVNRQRRCLVFADRGEIANRFSEKAIRYGVECLIVRAGNCFRRAEERLFEVAPGNPADFCSLLQDLRRFGQWPVQDVVNFWTLDQPSANSHDARSLSDEQVLSVGSVLHLVRAMSSEQSDEPARLWLVSRSAVALPGKNFSVEPTQAPIWGLGHAISLEHPEFRCTKVDLQGEQTAMSTTVGELCDELFVGDDGHEDRIVLANGRRFVARLRPLGKRPESLPDATVAPPAIALPAPSSGILEDLQWKPCLRRAPATNEVEIEVTAAGLNFRDVLTTLKIVPGNRERLGAECAGRIVSVGQGVTQFKLGDEVIAFALGGMASYVTVSADLVIHKPTSVSLDQAAGLTIAFLTSLYAFRRVTCLKADQRILIHAATGGVGSAAVQLAKLAGAEIFGTAGTPEKRALLKSWGVQHVFDSRSLSFADAIRDIVGERGIDVVLNSLAGEFVTRSLELVRSGGSFIELGKRDLLNPLDVGHDYAGVAYTAFDLAEVAEHNSDLIRSLFSELKLLVESGQVEPLPVEIFPAEQIAAAFRRMAQGRHIGKLVIELRTGRATSSAFSRSSFGKDGVWVVTGGLGGLGMRVSRWLVDQGVTRLALIGRRAPDELGQRLLEALRSAKVSAEAFRADVCNPEHVEQVLAQIRRQLGPIQGVVHAAGTLDDGTIAQSSWSRFRPVLAPKMDGAWNLHKATSRDSLDAFVLFSSAASILGSSGQGNYCAANAFLDALAHHRQAKGLPAVSVNWGVWTGAGMTANLDSKHRDRLAAHGLQAISVEEGFGALEEILHRGSPQTAVIPADWAQYVQALPHGASVSFLKELAPVSPAPDSPSPGVKMLAELNALPMPQRLGRMRQIVEAQAARALGLVPGKSINSQRPLHELGLDSLMSVELRNALAASFGRALSATLLFDYPTVESLTRYLAKEVLSLEATIQGPPEIAEATDQSELRELQNMSESEAESLLLAELDQLEESGI